MINVCKRTNVESNNLLANYISEFVYDCNGISLSLEEIDSLNSCSQEDVVKILISKGASISFCDIKNTTLKTNLKIIESNLDVFLATSLLTSCTKSSYKISDIVTDVAAVNPFGCGEEHLPFFYKNRMCRFLEHLNYGFNEHAPWNCEKTASSRYIQVIVDGKSVDKDRFYRKYILDYLYNNTYIKHSANKAQTIVGENNNLYLHLTFQIYTK